MISKCGHGKGVLLSPGFGHEKSREPKLDFLLGGAAGGRLIFSYKWLPDNTVGSGTTGTGGNIAYADFTPGKPDGMGAVSPLNVTGERYTLRVKLTRRWNA